MKKPYIAIFLVIMMLLSITGCSTKETTKNPVTITIWNYYNGDQLTAFEELVEKFNSTVGMEKGIVAVTVSQGDIDTLADCLLDSVEGVAGAQECPTLASVYAETAYILDQKEVLVAMDKYFTEAELETIVPGFLEEGRFNKDNELLLFPIIKSTELFTANETDWQAFAEATNITLESIQTKEDLTAAAEVYYQWTDALTPEKEDGKALYGRDSVANYVYLGAHQLGHSMFEVKNGQLTIDLDRDTFKTLWDNYYIPYINGYFGAYAKFRSEDAKTGQILALTSSSSSVGYLPTTVTLEDDSTHDISLYEVKDLPFANAQVDSVVQQGASYCMLKSTPAQQEGAAEFLKWLSDPEQNMDFAIKASYSPVTLKANSVDAIKKAYSGDMKTVKGRNVLNSLLISADVFTNNTAYATKPFGGSKELRTLIGNGLEQTAIEDRAAVEAEIAKGSSRQEAVAKYSEESYFDSWFSNFCAQVKEIVDKN